MATMASRISSSVPRGSRDRAPQGALLRAAGNGPGMAIAAISYFSFSRVGGVFRYSITSRLLAALAEHR